MSTTAFRTGYMDKALTDLPTVLREAKRDLDASDLDFDTLVGTGFSGGIVIPALATRLRKKFVLLRKENDDSHHGSGRLLGQLGERWLFVDDFISGGHTAKRVLEKVALGAALNDHKTTFVGAYLYTGFDPEYRIQTAEQIRTRLEHL